MPAIYFRFSGRNDDRVSEQVIVTVWPVVEDELGPALDPAIIESQPVAVSSNIYPGEETLSIPHAGTYLVDVNLPEGQRVRRTVTLVNGESYNFLIARPQRSVGSETEISEVANVVAASQRENVSVGDVELRCVRSSPLKTGQGIRQLESFLQTVLSLPGASERLDQGKSDASRQIFDLQPLVGKWPPSRTYERLWLVVRRKGRDEALIAYPAEWRRRQGPPFKFVIEHDRNSISKRGQWSSHLTLTDPYFASVVGYLHRRDWLASGAVLEELQKSPDMKNGDWRDYPFEAASKAYAEALGSNDDESCVDWLAQVRTQFEWLPDAFIAYGWRQLRNGERGTPEWADARLSFLGSVHRGLPYFSVGLHLLVDGLTLLSMATPDDREVKTALASVTTADLACVQGEPFTTLLVPRFHRLRKRANDPLDNGRSQ